MTTEAERAAEEFAHIKFKELMLQGVIPAGAGTLDLIEYGFLVGYNKGHAAALTPRKIILGQPGTYPPFECQILLYDCELNFWKIMFIWDDEELRSVFKEKYNYWLPLPPTPQREGE